MWAGQVAALAARVPSPVRMAAFWLLLLLVVALSLTPVAYLPPQVFDLWDKAQHAFGFAVLAVLGLWAYGGAAGRVLVGLLLLGVFIELAQSATGWRHGDFWDWVADAVGVAGAAAGRLSVRRFLKTG